MCEACGSHEITAYSYDGGKTTTGYECRDCGHHWRKTTMSEVELHGGPLDGMTVDADETDADPWIAIITDHGKYPGGRALYAPDGTGTWQHVRDLRPEEL